MNIVKSFLNSQLCHHGFLTYHCLCHNYLMDLQHIPEISLNKQKKEEKCQYLQCTFIKQLDYSCKMQIVNIVLHIKSYCMFGLNKKHKYQIPYQVFFNYIRMKVYAIL